MTIQELLTQYDAMFGVYSLEEIETFLETHIQHASLENKLTLLNEMIGFCRDTTQKEKGLFYCDELIHVLEALHLPQNVEYATSLLNLANAYRAFENYDLSVSYFEECLDIYKVHLAPSDFGFANVYNNYALLHQEMKDYKKSVECLEKALDIVLLYSDEVIKEAITRTNLAVSLSQLNQTTQALDHLKKAYDIFIEDGADDFHYNACLVALGDVYLKKQDYFQAYYYFKKGLYELEKHVGRNDNYQRVQEKQDYAFSFISHLSHMECCERFYKTVGKAMITKKFKDKQPFIAVGMVGEGSDCFGFDDTISKDHDYDLGFCMWLTKEDYEEIGASLQKEYDLIVTYPKDSRLQKRRGVFCVDDFYAPFIQEGFTCFHETLSTLTNGKVFEDEYGLFTKIRNQILEECPREVWVNKIGKAIHDFSQYGQSNYPRMMVRHDYFTAKLCLSKACETALDLVYLFERRYAPYYKWKKRGAESLPLGKKVVPIVEKILLLDTQKEYWQQHDYHSDQVYCDELCILEIERLAGIFLEELKRWHLVNDEDLFLENYVGEIINQTYQKLVDEVVLLEWKQFDLVKNKGGRASCQDDFHTFSMMRQSQYLTWPRALLESYKNDLQEANKKGWNLITEKYARMMASTSPLEYEQLKDQLPPLSSQRQIITEELVQIQVQWMEDFARRYPAVASNARSIHTNEDTLDNTSYETYLRGELGTYSDQTFLLYGRFIVWYVQSGKNLTDEIMENTVLFYGYSSLEEAQKRLSHDINA